MCRTWSETPKNGFRTTWLITASEDNESYRELVNSPSHDENTNDNGPKGTPERLHAEGVEDVEIKSKSQGKSEPGLVRSNTTKWYVGDTPTREEVSIGDAFRGDVISGANEGIRKSKKSTFQSVGQDKTRPRHSSHEAKRTSKTLDSKIKLSAPVGFLTKRDTKYNSGESKQIISAHGTSTGTMRQENHRRILIKAREQYQNMDLQEKRQLYKCGGAFLLCEQIPNWVESNREYTMPSDKTLSEKSPYQPNKLLNQKVALWYGDITRLEIDVVVNSTSLQDDPVGVNKAIRAAAGPALDLELKALGYLVTEPVFKTCGYRLPAKWIYHVLGDLDYWKNARALLSQCYVNVLNLMKEDKLRTIAFPCMWAGSRRLALDFSAQVALETVKDWLSENHECVDKIIFCVFEKTTWHDYIRYMHTIFPTKSKDAVSENTSKLPAEILHMDNRSIELYKKALEEGEEKDYSIRIMVTGPYGVGKSTFTKRPLCQHVDINERNSTDGIDVHVNKSKVSLETTQWTVSHEGIIIFLSRV